MKLRFGLHDLFFARIQLDVVQKSESNRIGSISDGCMRVMMSVMAKLLSQRDSKLKFKKHQLKSYGQIHHVP